MRSNSEMQGARSWSSRRLLVTAAAVLALISLLFLLEVVPHAHANGQDDPTCGLCQVAHMGVPLAVSLVLLSLVLVYFGDILIPFFQKFTNSFFLHSPSRAPPASLA